MAIPELLSNFNIADSDVSVWLFRKSRGQDGEVVLTGHWIDIDNNLGIALKEAVTQARESILETEGYSLTATLEPGQALTIETEVTAAPQIVEKAAEEVAKRKATTIAHIQNTYFYVVKLSHQNDVIHAVRRTDTSWASKKNMNLIKVIFEDDQLGLNPHPDFHLSRYVDFIIAGDEIVMLNKDSFEQVLSYKEAHASDFVTLQTEPAFVGVFTDIAPLVAFVGNNKLKLRRVCAIREKGHYSDAAFMANLRLGYAEAGLNLVFDDDGKLIANPDTCADIVRALLNHRLYSRFSEQHYDVPNAKPV